MLFRYRWRIVNSLKTSTDVIDWEESKIDYVEEVLKQFKTGKLSLKKAKKSLDNLLCEDIGFACIDHGRAKRKGFPEVIFCEGKTLEQTKEISRRLLERNPELLATRASREVYEAIKSVAPSARYNEPGRIVAVSKPNKKLTGSIAVVTAGTSDIGVAEEASETAMIMGSKVTRIYDVGVAGIHRLLMRKNMLDSANVIVVVAGMEGALASVVGGIVKCPVIAVPTSIGYGASFRGLAALLSMLNTCAPGVSVVNIDNGFGAGYMSAIINKGFCKK